MDAATLISLKQEGESFDSILHLLRQDETSIDKDLLEFLTESASNIKEVAEKMDIAARKGDLEEVARCSELLSDTFEMIKDSVRDSTITD